MRSVFKKCWPAAMLSLMAVGCLAACQTGTFGNGKTDSDTGTEIVPPGTEKTTDSAAGESTDSGTNGDTETTGADPDGNTNPADTTGTSTETPAEETDPADADIVKAQPGKLTFDTTLSVTENNGSAAVTHESGLSYTASGYQSVSNGAFRFTKGLALTFDPADTAADFNRFTLGYTSTQPLKGTVTYTEGDSICTDDFYLEAGTDTFSCVIGRYLKGRMGTGITAMTFETCNGESADFALCVLNTEAYPVYGTDSDTYYMENARYKLGIRLGWGGGISYIEDLRCPVKRLKNLVNQADTGRLIQQSYYGVVENQAYSAAYYNGSRWCYNPVQGGDVAQNHSRIIDMVVTDYSVYVKSQPQDWAKDNEITPSYMENTYTLYSDRIQVDNRFVDFSGWTHRYCHQELPAFYTVSFLSRFTLYNGTEPWTDGTMSYRDDLGFWGDGAYYNDCTFLMKQSNTETWCAWTNPSADFGIGLYVPCVDSFLAGRHSFNGSMDSTNGACNYVAPVNTIMLVSFDALEYSYLITTGSVEEIRGTFMDNRDFADNTSLRQHYQSRRVPDSTVAANEKSYADLG